MSRFGTVAAPIDNSKTIVHGDVRVSVITDRIIRVEKGVYGIFEDRPTQKIFDRNFAKPHFTSEKNDNKLLIKTRSKEFQVDLKSLSVKVRDGEKWVSHKDGKNLKGTARTLDFSWGKFQLLDKTLHVRMGKGLFSTAGVAEIDDSTAYALNEDGSVEGRGKGAVDKYVLAFGDDYLGGLKEFYCLAGATPVLPKYSLGNWWSRYHVYTQDEYIALMDKFWEKQIPLTVATIDMDWHLVKNLPKDVKGKSIQGPGWTGYTFNKKLFPDYKQFFKDLKSRGLAITMNLHPRDGVRYHEEQYAEMARANGIDPATKQPVDFDFTNQRFIESYFDILHHPYEDDGVDFWWIDWQQGTKSKLKGFDPLWALNHYHTIDSGREGRTPLILSRYAGIGAHRYPLGFSGDTFVRWSSLKLQPYFTSTASNVGYTWWSHDIGGHLSGKGDSELYVRWLQFGVFSPINRLHSNQLSWSKEPWLYGDRAEKISSDFLRLRHRLLPYLYTANIITARDGEPLVMPMYYKDKTSEAYKAKDQYYFGSELIVAPVLEKCKADGFAYTNVYLPKGKWTDFFTGKEYKGGNSYVLKTPLDRMPVFAKEGAIIPMIAERSGNSQIFDELEVRVYPGNGKYRMHDEGGYTDFEVKEVNGEYVFTADQSNNKQKAKITVTFCGKEKKSYPLEDGLTTLKLSK